ncbi:MAG: hypothetical protein JXQ71_08260 [Verrucomicrobia bacterium]|nr:hypothetical protein [Verrucomicrobiota bacterium]
MRIRISSAPPTPRARVTTRPRSRATLERRCPATGPALALALAGWLSGLAAEPLRAQPPAAAPAAADISAGAKRVASAAEVVVRWHPQQHLYVKGNVGLNEERLGELERWLDQHADHWTVVLLESAAGEQFTDPAGQSFTGMDAVEHALGNGLPNQTAFGQWTDPRTRERNGAFFVLFLKERQFSYYGSDAQDQRGLGEDRWAGQLDQPAIAAMRGGGRIADAVKDTITHIDRQLAERIASEERRRQQQLAAEQAQREQREAAARAEREHALAQATAALQNATAAINLLDQKSAALLGTQPHLAGDIARPNLHTLRADLDAAQRAFDDHNLPATRALADSARQRAQAASRALEDYLQAAAAFDAIDAALARSEHAPHRAAATAELDAARNALAKARQAHERADSGYVTPLHHAQLHAQTAAARIQAATHAAALRHKLTLAGAGALALAALGLGALLNRRRRPARREALSLLDAWTKALDEKTVALFALLERTHTIVGPSSAAAVQRFAGRTLDLSRQIIQDVDELIIMSACAQRLLTEGKTLARPTAAGPRLFNLFSTRQYRAAIRRLRDEPIVFQPEEGLALVVQGPKSERDTLLGPLESYQPFKLSFNELIAAFNRRAERALANLDRVAEALTRSGATLESVQQHLRQARTAEPDLAPPEAADRPFRLQPVFAELLPSAGAQADQAASLAIRDPVGALETHAATAQQQTADALALTQLALEFHRVMQPKLQDAANALAIVPLHTDWIDAAVAELSARADALAAQALHANAAPGIATVRDALNQLVERAAQTQALDHQRRTETQPSVDNTDALIGAARRDLGQALKLSPDAVLREQGQDPSECLAQGRQQLDSVKAALERGDVPAAQAGLDAAHARIAEATAVVDATRQAFSAHTDTLAAHRRETQRLDHAAPEHERLLVEIEAACAPSVLLLGAGDPTHPNANGTIQDNLRETRELLAAARALADQADRAFRIAHVLEAAQQLEQVAACHAQAGFRLQEIVDKHQRLQNTEAANGLLCTQLATRLETLAATIQDSRTMPATVQAFDAARQQLAQAERRRAATPRDPFQLALDLAAVQQTLNSVANHARRDADLHAEAQRSLSAAASQLEIARRLNRDASADSIPDSAAIGQAARTLDDCAAALARAQAAFQTPHGDWPLLDAEADRITSEAARQAATLRGELAAAQSSLAALSAAATLVRNARAWTGPFGVLIAGAPGADLLSQARAALNRGDYPQAGRLADTARRLAETAIAQAEAEALRRRRAEEERRERERRARQAAEQQRRRALNPTSFGGSGFGRSVFSSSAGTARSVFHSGSGVGRSGW